MKKVVFLLLAALVVGCAKKNDDGSYHAPKASEALDLTYIQTVVVDSCEYIYNSSIMAHKGNCRYCATRRKAEIEKAVKQIKGDDLW